MPHIASALFTDISEQPIEMQINNYQTTLGNIQEEQRLQAWNI